MPPRSSQRGADRRDVPPAKRRKRETRAIESFFKAIEEDEEDVMIIDAPSRQPPTTSHSVVVSNDDFEDEDDDFEEDVPFIKKPITPTKQSHQSSKKKKKKKSVKMQKDQSSDEQDVILIVDEEKRQVNDSGVDDNDVDDDVEDEVDEDIYLSEYPSIKLSKPPTKLQDGVVVCSLLKLFRPYGFSTIPTTEQQRRAYVVSHAIRFAAQEMGKINKLANMLMTLYLLDCIQHNRTIPLKLCDQNSTMWNWCMMMTSTVGGKHVFKPPKVTQQKSSKKSKKQPVESNNSLQEKMNRKNQMKMQKEEEKKQQTKKKSRKKKTNEQQEIENQRKKQQSDKIKSIKSEEKPKLFQRNIYFDLKRVFEEQFLPLLPSDFKWPDRSGLSEMQSFECQNRSTNFQNLYSTTFSLRQGKVVRKQVDEWLSLQQFNWTAEIRREIRFTITSRVVQRTNRWLFDDNKLETLVRNHMNRQQKQDLFTFINKLVQEHHQGFGNSPLQEDYYCLSQDDAGAHASFYVYYFHYLNQQYGHFASLKKVRLEQLSDQQANDEVEVLGKLSIYTKWRSFPIIPQVKLHVPFVKLNAKALYQLIRLTSTDACKQFTLSGLDEYVGRDIAMTSVATQVRQNPRLDWVNVTGVTDDRSAQLNPIPMFDQLFSGCIGYKKMLGTRGSRSKYKAIHFESIISTNGIQANIHYKTEQLIAKNNTFKKKGKQDEQSCDTITSAMFDCWIAEHKMLISVDPGHKDLIAAVRHHPPSSSSQSSLSSPQSIPTSRKGKQKQARHLRQQENNQSTYTLSNKCYYEISGFTAANATRRRWRKQSGLSDLDQYLSSEFETCNQTTWQSPLYQQYVEFITHRWTKIWNELCQVKYRKLRFRVYQKSQKAYAKIAHDLTNGSPQTCVVIWGNGSFGPTSKGHAAAPNKKLRKELAHHGVQILLGDEYMSSQNTACCSIKSKYSYQSQQSRELIGPQVEFPPPPPKRKLRGLLYCKHISPTHQSTNPLLQHATLHRYHGHSQASNMFSSSSSSSHIIKLSSRPWNRDVCASLNIMRIVYGKAYNTFPSCFKRPKTKKK